MIVTLGMAREALAPFAGRAGKCADSEGVRLFVAQAVERSLFKGADGNERKWKFHVTNGMFTAPPDLQTAVKCKVDGRPERVWSKWYEFFDVNGEDRCNRAFVPGLMEVAEQFSTIYDIPFPGARIAAVPLSSESADAFITIQGTDANGRDVYTHSGGQLVHGEKIRISREKPVYTKTVFSKVTSVEKTITNNHVRLYWQLHHPVTKQPLERGLLAEYRPTDTHPSYRRFRVPGIDRNCITAISVIGRVALLENYHDNDVLPITSLSVLRQIAITMQAEENKDFQSAAYFDRGHTSLIEDQNEYNRPATGAQSFDWDFDLSPGSIENLM
jgi:hypothetical protein